MAAAALVAMWLTAGAVGHWFDTRTARRDRAQFRQSARDAEAKTFTGTTWGGE